MTRTLSERITAKGMRVEGDRVIAYFIFFCRGVSVGLLTLRLMFTLLMMKVRLEILALVEYQRLAFSELSCAVAIPCLRLMRFLRFCRGERRAVFSGTAVVRPSGDALYVDTLSKPTHKLVNDALPYRSVPADVAEFDFAVSLLIQ